MGFMMRLVFYVHHAHAWEKWGIFCMKISTLKSLKLKKKRTLFLSYTIHDWVTDFLGIIIIMNYIVCNLTFIGLCFHILLFSRVNGSCPLFPLMATLECFPTTLGDKSMAAFITLFSGFILQMCRIKLREVYPPYFV